MRFLAGFSQSSINIYYPLFVDIFSVKQTKSFWMNMMLLAPAIGVFAGYCMTGFFVVQSNWRTSIIVIAVFSGLNSLIICMMPAHYMELRMVRKAIEKEDRKGLSRKTSFSDLSEIMEQGVFQRLTTNYPFIFLVLTLACY